MTTINKIKTGATINKIKTGLVKPVVVKTIIKRDIGSSKVTLSVRKKIIKIASQQNDQRDLIVYKKQMIHLRKLIFNIYPNNRVSRENRSIADMKEFSWASISQ